MNLKIWHKMIIGISVPSLIALIGGLFSYGYVRDVKDRQGFVMLADDLKESVLEVRRNEKNFLLHKDIEYFKYFQNSTSSLKNSLSNISAKTVEEIGENNFSQFREAIQIYSGIINDLYMQYQQEKDIIEKVREEGRKLETLVAVKKISRELSTSFILNLRRLEKNYMLFRDKPSFNALDSALTQIKNIIPFCFECVPYTESIYDLSEVYGKSDSLINDLQVKGEGLESITYKIAESERQKISAFLNHTQKLLVLALVLLCTLGPFLVYKTATYIAAPIKRLADITRKISEGDLNLRAPLKEHDETYSLALSFNTMLDHLQLTHESLEKSLELLHEKQIEAEKRASLGFLISGVTHELNNPLNNISLTAETMKEDLNGLSRKEMEECIQDILTQTERAKHIVSDVLEFVGTHKATVMEKLDIVALIEGSINLVANQLRVNNITLKTDIPNIVFFVNGNKNKLEEVFVNIIVNAFHAMKDSGTLTIGIRTDRANKNVFIDISDTGCGIPETELKNIFEPFFTTKPVGEGTGLGLSVTHSIIAKHKGDIRVQSRVGEGTTFTIRLPLYEEEVKSSNV
ncbi:MAG: HAMP domain-containing protein [Nitrospirae bacterium]|nr:HAMP domain-containing protein [Nitrospirota bacterium]